MDVDIVRAAPSLITELARASQQAMDEERRLAAQLMTLALRAADGVAFKFGFLDLSARLIDLMRVTALAAEDPALLAAVAYVRTETYFATGDLDTALRALASAIDQLPVASTTTAMVAAVGALHMRSAVVAARAGNADTAADHLADAARLALQTPEGFYHGTAYGPASLRIHELAVAVELRDPAGIERAARWQPPENLPAERRSHYYIELARAQLDLGRHDQAHQCLQTARLIAPQHTRNHPQVRDTLSALLRTHRAAPDALIDLAAWARAH